LRGHLLGWRIVSEPENPNVVDQWLATEAAASPACSVVAALGAATKSMKLDEGEALTKLRELYKEPPPVPEHVEGKTD